MPWDKNIENIYEATMTLLHGEMYRIHKNWFAEYASLYSAVTVDGIERGKRVTDRQLAMCRNAQNLLRQDMNRWMDEYGVDLWLTPSQGATAPKGDSPTGWGGMTTPWSLAGMPCISIPAGTLNHIPYGIQAIGRFGADESLIQWAHELARVFQS